MAGKRKKVKGFADLNEVENKAAMDILSACHKEASGDGWIEYAMADREAHGLYQKVAEFLSQHPTNDAAIIEWEAVSPTQFRVRLSPLSRKAIDVFGAAGDSESALVTFFDTHPLVTKGRSQGGLATLTEQEKAELKQDLVRSIMRNNQE